MTCTHTQFGFTELPEDIRIPLHELQADSDYLFGRVAADSSVAKAMSDSVKEKLGRIEVAIWEWAKELS